jgi:hypothetical protein
LIAIAQTASKESGKLSFLSDLVTIANTYSALQTTADAQWDALPAHFRLEGSLKQSNNSPFERDFLISIRLNYLHISFLLRRLLLRRLAEPDVPVLEVAQQMLHLVVEAILLRDDLANSGTGLDWKVCVEIVPLGGC